MKQNRDFHKQVRVVYRVYRRLLGKEKAQVECLRLFKIIYPEYYKAKKSDKKYYQLSDAGYDKAVRLLTEWMPEDGALHDLICYTLNELDRLMLREEFIQFCEDIMPVVMRIRKLTPTETGWLMGLKDDEIQKMKDAGLSNSQMYKLHGNSIVVDVMTALFDKLLINTEQKKEDEMQLTLF